MLSLAYEKSVNFLVGLFGGFCTTVTGKLSWLCDSIADVRMRAEISHTVIKQRNDI